MGARVTADGVKQVVETNLTDDAVLSSMIDTANLYVDTHLVPLSPGHTTKVLAKIELYLAAHLVALTEEKGGITRAKMGDADESYANVYKDGFNSTRFGQTALVLDTSGTLARLSITNAKAEFRVV